MANPPAESQAKTRGFTLIELLVVIAIIALLIGILLPAMGRAVGCVRGVRDASAARQLMIAYTMHADDRQGRLLPGYPSNNMLAEAYAQGDTARDLSGEVLPIETPAQRELVKRYPFRLLSYLGDSVEALYKDPRVAEAVLASDDPSLGLTAREYAVSLYPSFGINGFYVGGSDRDGGVLSNPSYKRLFGQFWVDRAQQVRHPSRLIVFAASRSIDSGDVLGHGADTNVEGFFEVRAPNEFAVQGRQWADEYDDHADPGATSGFVSLRHVGKAAVGVFDGHAEQLEWNEFNDMRWWSDDADDPDWAVEQLGG